MKAYIEITLLPDAEVGQYFLWGKLFQQVHLALVEMKAADGSIPIGLSFPEYSDERNFLGKKLRLFAREESLLEQLNIRQWLDRLSDYLHITSIRAVPEKVSGYARYRRVQTQSSKQRLARRKAKREGATLEQAMLKLEGFQEQVTPLPFVMMQSLGNKQKFRLFIAKDKIEQAIDNGFGSYGLSSESTVPEF